MSAEIRENAKKLIKQFEGNEQLEIYLDSRGIPTVGVGCALIIEDKSDMKTTW